MMLLDSQCLPGFTLAGWGETIPHSFLPLPHVHLHLLELLPNVLSCSQSQTLLFPCSLPMHSVPQTALSCHLSSPYPLSRWLPAMGSP